MLFMAGEDTRYIGLDILHVRSTGNWSECAILLEIWRFGALLQTSKPFPAGEVVEVGFDGGSIKATVDSCQQDPFGFIVEITVNLPAGWFPSVYSPEYLLPT